MKKTFLYASLLIASGAFLLSHLNNPSISRQVEAGVSHWTCKNTFSIVEEDGEEIYKKTGNLATIANLQYDYDFVYGSISFDARIDDANNLTSNYLGISLVNSSSKYWALRGQYKQTLVDFIYNNGSVDKEYKSAAGSFNPTKGSWASFKYEYTPTKLSCKISFDFSTKLFVTVSISPLIPTFCAIKFTYFINMYNPHLHYLTKPAK